MITVTEAASHSSYSKDHIKYLIRFGKVLGRKSGNAWLVDLESLKAYEERMKELGTKKYDPTKSNLTA